MAAVRDWEKTLWSASYKGFPFYFDRDEEEGGLGLVIHKFPNSDIPFIEDLGEDPRFFSGTAYLFGDDVDQQTAAFEAVLVSHGPGPLVVPLLGPVIVRLQNFKRTSEKDKLGYVAFDVKFVRDGAPTAILSVAQAQNQALIAANTMAAAIASVFPSTVQLGAATPQYVAEAASDALVSAAGAIDAVRTSSTVDPTVSATVRDQLTAIATAAPMLLASVPQTPAVAVQSLVSATGISSAVTFGPAAIAAATVATVRGLADGMDPAAAADAMMSLVIAFAPLPPPQAFYSTASQSAFANQQAVQQLIRFSALVAWCEALVGQTYTDRPSGVTARAEAAERLEIELNNCPGAAYAALFLAIEALQNTVVQYLTQLIANLAPVITVTAGAIMPSLYWAWRLYQDPTRSVDLTLRNQIRHPSFMPRSFVALAPGFAAPGIPTAWPAPPL